MPPDTDILKYSFKSTALNQYEKLNLDTFSPFTECYGCLIGKWLRPCQVCLLTNAMWFSHSTSPPPTALREKKVEMTFNKKLLLSPYFALILISEYSLMVHLYPTLCSEEGAIRF